MGLRQVLTREDPLLRRVCREVTDFGRRTQNLIDDLFETVVHEEGLGLAAPQVGVLRRAVVLHNGEEFVELINPKIIHTEGEVVRTEACLSCPGEMGIVSRPQTVTVRAQNRRGEWFEMTCSDMAARAVCHELDHLDGVLYTDKALRMLSEQEIDALENQANGEQESEP